MRLCFLTRYSHLTSAPATMPLDKKKEYQQKFRPEWQKDKSYEQWLILVPGNDSLASCRFCSGSFVAKLQNIKCHKLSETHKKHEKDRGLSGNQAQFMERYLAAGGTEAAKVKKRKEAELRMGAFIASHTSFRAGKDLAGIVGGVSDVTPKMGATKASMIIKNVLSPSFREDLISSVRGKPYTLIIDKATDCSVNKALGLII